ncbi:bifunctional dethiobiotin synthetase/7,8-diamino-pelargonic acid aminotransferase, mitochondrial isoform X2 [Sorghum bicolor]|uniref:bifunctional dethiobiotin synthetase/7,8-diamino-pelargonic acid aminotransferase, mitochondrial isoform X2 n=1 Tax=Sorghum bicolor TaxID=4558 RepID=UPI000B424674|nr:bifunctional dethiobiotin synthetase/7,8-diamino-pelargonic acid aminotransferase, mitochondrial isoform X2 [Sorghum bicolor]|eukprot:XP_021304673.1 bifunctional dethiobiotin synthetase/7,8-diamino-pelargonic acid aminotransferase, mitochondrial isoform X2 [Sorghum bicolor]
MFGRLFLHHARRRLHSSGTASSVPLSTPTFAIFGANTGVGKTLVSAGLAAALLCSPSPSVSSVSYLKPLQTGYPVDSDARFVFSRAPALLRASASPRATRLVASCRTLFPSPAVETKAAEPLHESQEKVVVTYGAGAAEQTKVLACCTAYAWREPVSPHLAAEREGMAVGDDQVKECVAQWLLEENVGEGGAVWKVLETAGGVASPGASGTLQCDLYRPFRLPAILVGDGRLGGISSTLSAYETLLLRGYDVSAVILEDRELSNDKFLLSYLRNRVHVLTLPQVPEDPSDDLTDWFSESSSAFNSLKDALQSFHSRRIERLNSMQRKSKDLLWWPFTQHNLVPQDSVTVIDSRCGENFSVYKIKDKMLVPQFDACASWWTQGPDSNLQIELARDMGYAAARYGHVMFPENVHEPALRSAEVLLGGVGKGWASRVYYSDNGSTAIEIALKMAFRKFCLDHGIMSGSENSTRNERNIQLKVLALNGSYHGDTLGAMEAQAPSAYTSFLQQPWYSGRGLFLDPPTVYTKSEVYNISLPQSMQHDPQTYGFSSQAEVFCKTRDKTFAADLYSSYIKQKLSEFSLSSSSEHLAALIIEPVIQGAGGMLMIDPLFQRVLVSECRSRKIPVIFDEVFTGFWRLGVESASELLGCLPDIACYAKLMTGGIVPLAATLATEEVFESFEGDSKLTALLHGHSYTAHAMGCTAALKAMQWYRDPSTNLNLDADHMKLKELWDGTLVKQLSSLPNVKRVVSLGTICAIELKAEGSDAGYASLYASSLVQQLRKEDDIYIRPLGNVIYLMCGPCTPEDSCTRQLLKVHRRLCELN